MKSMSKPMVLAVAALASCAGMLAGCGAEQKDGAIVESEVSKKSNAATQDAMKEFMQSKGQTKAKPAAPPAVTPQATPSKS
jgi:ABC-type uncharacterized transport system auxiliary subunit